MCKPLTGQSCHQGYRARYAGLRCRQVVTVSGLRWLKRAYYYCAQCGGGWCRTDLALGPGQGQCSRRVQVLIARFSSYLPYRTVSQEMEAVCGIRLATRTIARYAQALGQRLGQEWERLEQVREAEDLPASDLPVSMRPSRLHVTMDGVMVHVGGDWHEVRAWPAKKASDQELQRRLVGYLSKHQARMRYQRFRAAGYHIGSGVAESGCENVVQQRMKGPGMRWSKEGAEARLQLCAHWKSAGVKYIYAYTAPQAPH